MKNNLKLSMIILTVLELIFMFMPIIFKEWLWHKTGISYTQTSFEKTNFFDGGGNDAFPDFLEVFSVITFILITISLICLLILFILPKSKAQFLLYSPAVTFLVMIIYSFLVLNSERSFGEKAFYSWELNWGYYILMGIHFLNILFMLIIKLKKDESAD